MLLKGVVNMPMIGTAMLYCITQHSCCIAVPILSVLTRQNCCLLEIEALHGSTSSMRLQDEIEMLASSIEQTTRSMSKLTGVCMSFF